jgi:hypothetical protein
VDAWPTAFGPPLKFQNRAAFGKSRRTTLEQALQAQPFGIAWRLSSCVECLDEMLVLFCFSFRFRLNSHFFSTAICQLPKARLARAVSNCAVAFTSGWDRRNRLQRKNA